MIAKCPDKLPLLDWAESMDKAEIMHKILLHKTGTHHCVGVMPAKSAEASLLKPSIKIVKTFID